jgi:hypothetical protein
MLPPRPIDYRRTPAIKPHRGILSILSIRRDAEAAQDSIGSQFFQQRRTHAGPRDDALPMEVVVRAQFTDAASLDLLVDDCLFEARGHDLPEDRLDSLRLQSEHDEIVVVRVSLKRLASQDRRLAVSKHHLFREPAAGEIAIQRDSSVAGQLDHHAAQELRLPLNDRPV